MEATFVDAQQMHTENPDTFEAPSQEDLDALKGGDYVKVCANEKERFWVKVTEVEGENIKGNIDNELVHTSDHGLKLNDEVQVEKRHAYQVHFENESWG